MLADKVDERYATQTLHPAHDALYPHYFVTPTASRHQPGDTIEIVRRIKGGRHHRPPIEVRATARFCAAYARGGERTEIPASHLLNPRLPSH